MSEIGMKIPRGKAVALPSVRISDEEESSIRREFYGGKGDKPHLGGFTEFDVLGVSPSLWKHMISKFGIKSVLDVGCGRGIATAWFVAHELDYVVSFICFSLMKHESDGSRNNPYCDNQSTIQ